MLSNGIPKMRKMQNKCKRLYLDTHYPLSHSVKSYPSKLAADYQLLSSDIMVDN